DAITFQFVATDPDNDGLRYQLEFLRNGSVVRIIDQRISQEGWDQEFYSSGSLATCTVSLESRPLPAGVTHWRVQAYDGRVWGPFSEPRALVIDYPELPLGTLLRLSLRPDHAPKGFKLKVVAPQDLFITVGAIEERVWRGELPPRCEISLLSVDGATIATTKSSGWDDILLKVPNLPAGEYHLLISGDNIIDWHLRVAPDFPSLRFGQLFSGTLYRRGGDGWLQIDVPEGTRNLDFTVEAPGTVTFLEVWRGEIGSREYWLSSQWEDPPVRLTIPNPAPGRYYLRIRDWGILLEQSQVRQFSVRVAGPQMAHRVQVAPDFATPERELDYVVTYANVGDAPATDLLIENLLPSEVEVVQDSISDGGVYDAASHRVIWTIGTLAPDQSERTVRFRVRVKREAAEGSEIVNTVRIRSLELSEPQEAVARVPVTSPHIYFENTHTIFDTVTVQINGLGAIPTDGRRGSSPSRPRVSLLFPAGTASSEEIVADEVTESEDGRQIVASFRLLGKVVSPVAPRVRLQHPVVGERTWQGPILSVPMMRTELIIPRTTVRLGREERLLIRITNQHSFPETPLVALSFSFNNVPVRDVVTIAYRVLDTQGREISQGHYTMEQESVLLRLPPVHPYSTQDFTLMIRVTSGRTGPALRQDPLTIGVALCVAAVTFSLVWLGRRALERGCEEIIKHRMRTEAARYGRPLTQEEVDQMYERIRRGSEIASNWLSQVRNNAPEWVVKSAIRRVLQEYLGAAAAELVNDIYEMLKKAAKGELGFDDLVRFIVSKLFPGFNWAGEAIDKAFDALKSEIKRCIENSGQADDFMREWAKNNCDDGRLRPVAAWDPNAKGGTFGVDGFIAGDGMITYIIFFENLPTATAAAEEVLIEDILPDSLDLESLTFTQWGVGDRVLSVRPGTRQLAEDLDLRPAQNLILQVRSRLDPATRKLTVTFKGIDPATGEHHPDGFLPPNVNAPQGEGFVSFQIRPRADLASGTVITNKATIIFDPHLGVNP
ncbi:MAG: DUF11 domain-containing protein, partial [Armatimonadetes bacterium]|nr:DUF11 domain-containing protein [Armatimonadota bacterium]MDW8123111.1 DUF11 domain-containing protein [Armatimonadota bacterium]